MSTDTNILKGALTNYLTTYLLKNVWNNPYSEFRQNIRLRLVSNTKAVNSFIFNNKRLKLPDRKTYYIYECPIKRPLGIYPLSDEWIKVKDFINQNRLDLRIHGQHGEWLFRDAIYLKIDSATLIIAISSDMLIKFIDSNLDLTKIYLSLYNQSTSDNKLKITCRTIDTATAISDIYVDSMKADIVFVNGREAAINSTTCFKIGDNVELISDPDILGSFIIKESSIEEYKTFIDSSDSKEKIILHIPKDFNAQNWLITHNTCDIFIRPTFLESIAPNQPTDRTTGAFISRVNTEADIAQITHNDFYISKDLVNEYKDHYNLAEGNLRVIVRRANKTDKLTHERNYISMLYQLTDSEILTFLSGTGDSAFSFWTADVLANSVYSKTLYKLQKPEVAHDLTIHLETFGYLACLDLVCGKVQRYTVQQYTGHSLVVPIPISMLYATDISCNISVNGVRISSTMYSTIKNERELQIELNPTISLIEGQSLIFELFENISPRAEYITPSAESNRLPITGEVLVFRTRILGTDDTFTTDKISINYSVNKSYELVTSGYTITTVNNNLFVVFTSATYGNEYLVVSKNIFAELYTTSFSIDSLNNDIISTGVITMTCKKWTAATDITIPVLWNNFLVYMDGYELAKPIDYSVVKLESNNSYTVGYVAHINSVDYLEEIDNELTVVGIPDYEIIRLNNFSHNNTNDSIFDTLMWFDNLNMLTADGIAIGIFNKNIDTLTVLPEVDPGALLHTRLSISNSLKELFEEASIATNITVATDLARIQLIMEFLKRRQAPGYKLSRIEKSHNVYSIITTLVIRDFLDGTLVLDPELDLLPQLTDYLALDVQDIVVKNNILSVFVNNSDYDINGEYVLEDITKRGFSRVWKTADLNNKIEYNISEHRWELIRISDTTVLFKSSVVYADYEPWLLLWEAENTIDTVLDITSEAIDLRFIDTFPSYRVYDINATVGYADRYNLLKDVIEAIFPIDKIQDGVTLQ